MNFIIPNEKKHIIKSYYVEVSVYFAVFQFLQEKPIFYLVTHFQTTNLTLPEVNRGDHDLLSWITHILPYLNLISRTWGSLGNFSYDFSCKKFFYVVKYTFHRGTLMIFL